MEIQSIYLSTFGAKIVLNYILNFIIGIIIIRFFRDLNRERSEQIYGSKALQTIYTEPAFYDGL